MKLIVPLIMSVIWSLVAGSLMLYGEVMVITSLVPDISRTAAALLALMISLASLVIVFRTWARLLLASSNFRRDAFSVFPRA